MQIQLNFPKKLGGKFYAKGKHSIDDALANDWFFKALVKEGEIIVLARDEMAQKIQALKDKLEADKAGAKPLAAKQSENPIEEDAAGIQDSEEVEQKRKVGRPKKSQEKQ